jgi:hypothetical protein
VYYLVTLIADHFRKTWGGFHRSWAQRVKRTKIWETLQKVERKAQMQDAKLELIFFKKDGREAHISSVGRKWLYEIHPWSILILMNLD